MINIAKTGVTNGAVGFDQQIVTVASVDPTGQAIVLDRWQRYLPPMNVANYIGSGALPQPGERWMVDRSGGGWTFKSRVQSQSPVVTTIPGLVEALDSLGFVDNDLPTAPTVASLSDVMNALKALGIVLVGDTDVPVGTLLNSTTGPGSSTDYSGTAATICTMSATLVAGHTYELTAWIERAVQVTVASSDSQCYVTDSLGLIPDTYVRAYMDTPAANEWINGGQSKVLTATTTGSDTFTMYGQAAAGALRVGGANGLAGMHIKRVR